MAERRMFAKTIIDSDAFLDMPISARLLYYDLAMRADDDGFVNSPKKILKMVGATQDDLSILVLRKFIIPFDNGVVVIKHWYIHNYIRKDTYNETPYKEQKAMLEFDENKSYRLCDDASTERLLSVDEPSTQVRLGKDSIDKDSIDNNIPKPQKHKYGEYNHVLLTDEERDKLFDEYGELETTKAITVLDVYIEMKGYKAKNHYLCMRKWVFKALNEQNQRSGAKQRNPFDVLAEV